MVYGVGWVVEVHGEELVGDDEESLVDGDEGLEDGWGGVEEQGQYLCMVDCDLWSFGGHYGEADHDEDGQHGLHGHGDHEEVEIHDYVYDYVHVYDEVYEVVLGDDGWEKNEPYVLYYLLISLDQCKNVL